MFNSLMYNNPELYAFSQHLEGDGALTIEALKSAEQPINPGDLHKSQIERLAERGVDIVDTVTALPGKAARTADRINDKFIDVAKDVEKAVKAFGGGASEAAEKNLTSNKVAAWGRSAADWIQDNMLLAGAVGLVVLFVIFRR